MTGDRSRQEWVAQADQLLDAARRWASASHARIDLPGAPGGYGSDVDGLEGFARTFLLAGFRIAGARGQGVDDLIAAYSRGITAGVDPSAPDRWVRLDEHPQAKVEAASIALILDLTRPWIWDRLDAVTQGRVIDYLAPAVGDPTYPPINWLWFRLVVQTFLRSVDGPWSKTDVRADLALHDTFRRAGGWLADGTGRAFDHYTGWALNLYPVLWGRMQGAEELADGRTADDVETLDRYLQDAVHLVGGDGSPLLQGRSLIYRFAAAAPFWAGVIAEVPSLSPGLLRHAADAIVGHFTAHGVPDADGLLSAGWHHPWPRLAQSYSGPGSPYWAVKGLLGVALPADHPVWSAPAEPLPIERGDVLRAVEAPGWLVSGTRADGVVRVVNHGTDHAHEGDAVGDSPLYARLGYSTATSPLLDAEAWTDPLEQSVAVLGGADRASHRAGMTMLRCAIVGEGEAAVGVAASRVHAHWLEPDAEQHDHGSGRVGAAEPAGELEVTSLVRGPWEVRIVRVRDLAATATSVRVGGWPVLADGDLTSILLPVPAPSGLRGTGGSPAPDPRATVETRPDAGPLGGPTHVPVLTYPARNDDVIVTLLGLARAVAPHPADAPASAAETADAAASALDPADAPAPVTLVDGPDGQVQVTWPDGATTSTRIT